MNEDRALLYLKYTTYNIPKQEIFKLREWCYHNVIKAFPISSYFGYQCYIVECCGQTFLVIFEFDPFTHSETGYTSYTMSEGRKIGIKGEYDNDTL